MFLVHTNNPTGCDVHFSGGYPLQDTTSISILIEDNRKKSKRMSHRNPFVGNLYTLLQHVCICVDYYSFITTITTINTIITTIITTNITIATQKNKVDQSNTTGQHTKTNVSLIPLLSSMKISN
jgi:hypothetical protein